MNSPLDHLDELYKRARDIMEKKNHDYTGSDADPYSNFRGSILYEVDPIIGVLIRQGDKQKRIESFVKKGTLKVVGESVDDALIDIINYCALMRGLIKEKQDDVPA